MKIFKEIQTFSQWWIKVLLFIPLFEALAFLINDYQKYGEIQTDSIIFLAVVFIIILFIFSCTLSVEVNEHGIYYKFFPFHLKVKTLPWEEITDAYIRQYAPLREYGGWGIRGNSNNRAYNLKGGIGLQLELTNGKKLLIGIQQASQLNSILQQLKNNNHINAIR